MRKVTEKETELIWPGKYNGDDTRKELPTARSLFSIRERLSGGRGNDTCENAWRNKLIWGDNLPVMNSLLEQCAGKIDLIYIDPPFATGADFMFAAPIGEDTPEERLQEQAIIEKKAYRDTWGRGLSSYLSMLWCRLPLLKELLSDTGSIYVHLGWDINGYVLALMNEIFGLECLQNIIVYNYGKFHHSKERWKRDFDLILFYSKNPERWTFNHEAVLDEYQDRTEIRFDKIDAEGRRYKIVKGRRVYYQGGVTPSSVWRLSNLQRNAVEYVGYPTQKTEELLTKIITASSNPGDLVADFFCGSGTTLAVAEKLSRRWIGCDSSLVAIHTARKRLLDVTDCRPFDMMDLEREQEAMVPGERQLLASAHLEMKIKVPKQRTTTVTLTDFAISTPALIPAEVRAKVKKWSDYIDYWAVDWDFRNDLFTPGWVTYRSRKNRTLLLASAPHIYDQPGTYQVLVRVIDIFGNETSRLIDIEV